MTVCASCRWWEALRFWDQPTAQAEDGTQLFEPLPDGKPDYSKPIKVPGPWGWCHKVDFYDPSPGSKFYVRDGSEYTATLQTRGDFGCTEHEPGTWTKTSKDLS